MTVHQAKGLEAARVHLLGCHDGGIPHMGRDDFDEEEEVRIAYVALTRASDRVHVSWSVHGLHEEELPWSKPTRQRCSRFFCEEGGLFRHRRHSKDPDVSD